VHHYCRLIVLFNLSRYLRRCRPLPGDHKESISEGDVRIVPAFCMLKKLNNYGETQEGQPGNLPSFHHHIQDLDSRCCSFNRCPPAIYLAHSSTQVAKESRLIGATVDGDMRLLIRPERQKCNFFDSGLLAPGGSMKTFPIDHSISPMQHRIIIFAT